MPFLGDLGFWKIVIIAVVVLILFGGATRLPIFAKGLGQSVKVFRKEMKDVGSDIKQDRAEQGRDERGRDESAEPVYTTTEPPAESDRRTPGSPRS
jgi:sec-independent protein translocase protein TatA